MASITVWNIDEQGWFKGTSSVAYESPLEPGSYLIPAGAVKVEPVFSPSDGLWPKWNGDCWELHQLPKVNLNVDIASDVRAKRNALLAETDWVFIADRPTDKDHPKWLADIRRYRQELRDITLAPDFPNVTWPKKP